MPLRLGVSIDSGEIQKALALPVEARLGPQGASDLPFACEDWLYTPDSLHTTFRVRSFVSFLDYGKRVRLIQWRHRNHYCWHDAKPDCSSDQLRAALRYARQVNNADSTSRTGTRSTGTFDNIRWWK
jgi:hypothetical protein